MHDDPHLSAATISIRIVHIDHYQQPLQNYSSSVSFQAARLTAQPPHQIPKLPVLRIFGSTPAGQSCCLHIHGLRPYLYLPLSPSLPPSSVPSYAHDLRLALESALHSAYDDPNAPPSQSSTPTPFIADIEPVLKFDIYGFYPTKNLFLKLSTYAPQTVQRIATIISQRGLPSSLSSHAVLPYASHIPFVMQFLVDYSLAGMDYIHLSSPRFRLPLPDPPPRLDARRLFTRPNLERCFVAGLQQVNEALFWPFHVAKRSTCPVELDSFPEHILNASPFAPSDSRYNFTSRTLTVLWEEERLRTGIYPPRAEKKKRIIKAGASLTDEDMLERLKEVCNAKETSPSQEASMQNEHAGEDERGAYVESGAGEEEVDSSAIFTMQSSYEDMLNILDASASFPTEEAIIEPFEDGQNEEAIDEEGKEDFEEDEVEIKRTWDDIADCTQNTSSTDHEDRIKAETVRRLDEECASQVVENEANSSRTDLKGFQLVHIASISKPNLNCKKFLGEDIAASSPGVILEPRDEGLMDIDSKAHSYLNQVNSPVSSGKKTVVSKAEVGLSPGTCLIVRPKARPPSREMINETTSDGKAFIISYTTPFFSERKDEVKRSEIFGGRRIHVRKSGADGYIPFPCYFGNEYGSTIVEVLPRIICPIKKPPTIAALRNALVKTTGNMARLSKNESVMIDSAGRQVQLGNKGDALEQLTGSLEPNYDIVKGIHDDIDLARLLNEDPNSTSSSDVEVGAHRTVPSTPIRDGSDALEYNRPMSPKYDEAYQIRSDRLLDSGARNRGPSNESTKTTPKGKISSKSPKTPKSGLKSHPSGRNSTVSLSESLHKYQQLTMMSIEILASSYADKLPDPAQNGILAACVVTRKDEEKNPRGSTSCVTLVVNKSSHPTIQHTIVAFESETLLLDGLATHLRTTDPDVVVGFETQNGSIGYILERAQVLGHSFAQMASRWLKGGNFDANRGATSNSAAAAYYHRKGADIKITGRHVLSLWRIVRTEVKLPAYSREAVAFELFSTTFPKLNNNILEEWFSSSKQFERAILHLERTASLNVAIVDKLNILGRTGELARVFGIDFMSVLTRGSQFRVESMMRRVSRARNYVLLAAPREEVYRQPAVEALPLVMEPQSALYVDPVIVLDFQSLYPSMIIAHNLCFSTMLGNVNRISSWNEQRRIGVKTTYNPPTPDQINGLDGLYIASNGEMFVDASVRRGILPQLLEEILETRVMVKTAMKNIINDDATANMLNARQFGLKMIANVTYGYTSASFSGRMPCSGLADTIVQSGRDALEEMIRYVEDELREETGATVVYGDTDSLFVRVPGATRDEAFGIGERIVKKAQEKFPDPVTLKLEKVYQPCLLQSKKRYVGYAYETRSQAIASFDAKGIETIRRDACPLVQKALEKTLRILFETRDISLVKRYVQRLCNRLQEGRIPFTDLIFRKEVKLGRYKEGHLPPAAIVASKSIDHDARRTPRHGERVPFVVIYERAGAPLKECVVSPEMYISGSMQGGMRLNTTYYITKQILPALNRALSLVGIRVATWYAEMPRRTSLYESSGLPGRKTVVRNGQSNLKMFYNSNICRICHGNGGFVCEKCKSGEKGRQSTQYILAYRLQQAERTYNKLRRKCVECAGRVASEECINLDCDTNDAMKVTKRRMQLGWEVMQ